MFEHQSVRIPFFQPRLGYGQGNWNSIPKRDRVFSFPQRSYHIRVLPHSYPMGPVGVFLGIVRPKRDGVTGEWRKLHNEGKNEMGEACGTYGKREVCTRFWWGNLREKRRFGRPRRRWEDNIKMDLQEVGPRELIHVFV